MMHLTKQEERIGLRLTKSAATEYRKEVIKVAKRVKRGTKSSHLWLDMLERIKRTVEYKYIDESRQLFGYYNSFENRIVDAVEQVDRDIFGQNNLYGVHAGYCFADELLLKVIPEKK
jgi:hypothetical protein